MNKKALPVLFLENMKKLFYEYDRAEEYDRFIRSFSEEPKRGIRMNLLKLQTMEEAKKILWQMIAESATGLLFNPHSDEDSTFRDATLIRIPWSDDGYYISDEFFPGRHPFYLAGLFYIQEPSAMLPAHVLDAKPGEHVLDLCAAPGGKTAKIAADMKGKGILISNDINETRVKALVRNVELMGCSNCVVLNESPAHIAQRLQGYFDKILLDAPCSGEGMFRRDPGAIDSWEKFGNPTCAVMQKEILSHVDCLLKPGGILVYSTCTFSTVENEKMIQWFLREYPWYDILPIEKTDGIVSGFSHEESLRNTVRIFPHLAAGEGHFCAKLQKKTNPDVPGKSDAVVQTANEPNSLSTSNSLPACKERLDGRKRISRNVKFFGNESKNGNISMYSKSIFIEAFQAFSKDVLTTECIDLVLQNISSHFQMIQGHAYTLPEEIPSMDDLKIIKKGMYLGELKQAKNKVIFEPSHSFLLSLNQDDLLHPLSFPADDPILLKYLKGETIFFPLEEIDKVDTGNRFVPICTQGYPIGWGKAMQENRIKNLYPQGWRR